jgi:hypothetical protein
MAWLWEPKQWERIIYCTLSAILRPIGKLIGQRAIPMPVGKKMNVQTAIYYGSAKKILDGSSKFHFTFAMFCFSIYALNHEEALKL